MPVGQSPGEPPATESCWSDGPRADLAGTNLRDIGIRVPGFLVRRFVDVSVSAQATRQA